MLARSHPVDVVRFGPFEADLREGVLRKHGVRVRLQAQPFQILTALLENAGTVVTREELRSRLWPDDTFVDFEHGLNAAVTRLRRALADSADEPRYIETLAKRGYRFIAEVQGGAVIVVDERDGASAARNGSTEAVPAEGRNVLFLIVIAVIAVIAAAMFIANHQSRVGSALSNAAVRTPQQVWHPVPLTTFPGREIHPALSPDGSQVAFSWNGEKQDNFDIYVMPLPAGAPLRLTTDPADDLGPAWSPDGRKIAFVRRSGSNGRGELLVVPTSGGPEHRIHQIRNQELRLSPGRLVSPDWSPDGAWIATSHRQPEDSSEGIYLFALTGETRKLTSPSEFPGDEAPAFSPDGRNLAFCRLAGFGTSEIYVLPLDSKFWPAGNPRRLTNDKRWSANPEWAADGSGLIYVSGDNLSDRLKLSYLDISDPQAKPVTIPLIDNVRDLSAGRRLVYTRHVEDLNIWRATIPVAGEPPAKPERLISSTWRDLVPTYSPDGKKIVFNSSRSGSAEVWVSNSDGSEQVPMTSFGGPLIGTMSWSPDGQWIAFHARPEGKGSLFVIPAAGGSPKRLTTGSDDTHPLYSRDGRWIYFGSSRSGVQQIWRMPVAGGEAKQITTKEGILPLEASDGKTIYFLLRHGAEIWSVPAQGGEATKVITGVHHYPTGFAVTATGIYYQAPPDSGNLRFIRYHSFATGEDRPIAVASHPFHLGMSVSPDSKYILFDQYDESGDDLMLVENFTPR